MKRSTLPSIASTERQGFTLVELLVVLGIIVLLISILLPVIGKVRTSAQIAATQQQIGQISAAITQYYTDYVAYPGPCADNAVNGVVGNSATLSPPGTVEGIAGIGIPSGAENLVLGLMGGLIHQPTDINCRFNWTEVGLGPRTLNLASVNAVRHSPYMSGAGLISTANKYITQPSVATSVIAGVGDTIIPEFMDRFSLQQPILYFRARQGNQGALGGGVISFRNVPADCQYDLADNIGYITSPNPLPAPNANVGVGGKVHNLAGIETGILTSIALDGRNNAGAYFADPSVTNFSSSTWNATGHPRQINQYILISAGPDGIYGTTDDITSYGNVSQ